MSKRERLERETVRHARGCRCAIITDEFGVYECEVLGGECEFFIPDSKKCAELFGEGPDAGEVDHNG